MFCPECGTENSRGQKFCTRCGTSLLAVEYARSIVNELAAGKATNNDLAASSVLRMTAVVSVLGLLFIMLGTIFLSLIYQDHHGPPVGLFFGVSALIALVIIVKQILKLVDRAGKSQSAPLPLPTITTPLAAPQHRPLTESNQTYYSVTEERTRQLENQ